MAYEGVDLFSNETENIIINNIEENVAIENNNNILTFDIEDSTIQSISNEQAKETSTSRNVTKTSKRKNTFQRIKPLSVLTEKLVQNNDESNKTISQFTDNFKEFTQSYIKIKNKTLEYEKYKLHFEIAKFKFLNPKFEFHQMDKLENE